MTQKLEHRKRSILENLNGHLQMSAIRLRNIEIETNILPEKRLSITKQPIKTSNKAIINRIDLKKTHNIIPLIKNPVKNHITKSNKTPMRILKPYDPLYTWNRGGRLKELRIRCQARKFLYIWRNKSIGKVTELIATQHYRKRLKRMAWNIWYEQYWRLRIEPRLFGRAILFHKSFSIRHVFTEWVKWTKFRLQTTKYLAIAHKFHCDNVGRSALNNWIAWVFVKKCKLKLQVLAQRNSREITLKSALNIWKIEFRLKTEINVQMAISVSHYNKGLLKKVIHEWTCIRSILRQSKLNRIKSENHLNSSMLKLAFNQWLQYHHKAKIKHKEKERWNRHYNWNLAHRYLMEWKQQHTKRLTETAMAHRCQALCSRFQSRKYLIQWKQYFVEKKARQVQWKLADQMNRFLIKKRAWCQLKAFVLQEQENKSIKERAQLFVNKSILRRYLDKWMSRLEEKEDLYKKTEMGAARSHFRRVMHMKYFRKWSKFSLSATARNRNLSSAIKMNENRLMKNAIHSWSEYVIVSKNKSRLTILKQQFVRRHVVSKYLNKWIEEKKTRESLEIEVSQYLRRKKYQKKIEIFQKWYLLTKAKLDENVQASRVQNHVNKRLLSNCFMALLHNVQSQHQRKINIDLASIHWQEKLKNKVFLNWKVLWQKKKHQTELLLWRFHKTEYQIKRIVLKCWIEYTSRMKSIREQAQTMFERQRIRMLIQTFHAWRTYKQKRKYRKTQSYIILKDGQVKLDDQFKKSIFRKWKDQARVRLLEIQKANTAVDLYRTNCLRKFITAWKQYHSLQQVHALQAQQSSFFWQKSTLIRIWLIWRQALADRNREHYYTRFALIHWANKLQEKIFINWSRYANERKEKARQEDEAFSEYKTRLKRYTIRQWMLSGDFLIQWRNQQDDKSGNIYRDSVRRAIDQWKRFTAIRCNRTNQTNRKTLQTFPADVKQSCLKLFHKHISQPPKIRSQPKIPDFLRESRQIDRKSPTTNTDMSGRHKNQSENRIFHSDFADETLLPPKCFESNSHWPISSIQPSIANGTEPDHQLYEEIKLIKEKLQHFKESKSILMNLQEELSEYEKVLAGFSPSCDASFYEEFDPTVCRARLKQSIELLEIDISQQKLVCIDLSKRFQEIMKIINK